MQEQMQVVQMQAAEHIMEQAEATADKKKGSVVPPVKGSAGLC